MQKRTILNIDQLPQDTELDWNCWSTAVNNAGQHFIYYVSEDMKETRYMLPPIIGQLFEHFEKLGRKELQAQLKQLLTG